MPYAQTELGRLFLRMVGSGPPVTLWSCLFGDSSLFGGCVEAVADRHRLILVDGPSHGRSEPHRSPFTLEQCADAWVRALELQGVEPPVVFGGLSWGSMVALRVALRHPRWVRGLLLMSTIATGPTRKRVPRFLLLAQTVRVFGFPAWLIDRMIPSMVSREALRSGSSPVKAMLERNRFLDREALHQAAMAVLVRRTDIVDQLWRIEVPTWILAGREDRTTPPRAARTVARAIAGSRLRELDGTGHLMTLEAPGQVAGMVREALEQMRVEDT